MNISLTTNYLTLNTVCYGYSSLALKFTLIHQHLLNKNQGDKLQPTIRMSPNTEDLHIDTSAAKSYTMPVFYITGVCKEKCNGYFCVTHFFNY